MAPWWFWGSLIGQEPSERLAPVSPLRSAERQFPLLPSSVAKLRDGAGICLPFEHVPRDVPSGPPEDTGLAALRGKPAAEPAHARFCRRYRS